MNFELENLKPEAGLLVSLPKACRRFLQKSARTGWRMMWKQGLLDYFGLSFGAVGAFGCCTFGRASCVSERVNQSGFQNHLLQ